MSTRLSIRNLARRWLRILAALVLAIGSTGHAPQVHAAMPHATQFRFALIAVKDTEPVICVGDEVLIHTRMVRVEVSEDGAASNSLRLTGIVVNAVVLEPSIGYMKSPQQTTTVKNNAPGTATFTFVAAKSGTTKIAFDAYVNESWWGEWIFGPFERYHIETKLTLKVSPCLVSVDALMEWHVPGPANIMIVATVDRAEMRADDQGHFTGSGTVDWIASAGPVGDCSGTLDIGSSQADLTGDMDGNGQIAMQMNFQPAAAEFNADCGPAGGERQEIATPDALAFSIPDSGGVIQQPQGLGGPGVTGTTTIIVTPQEDEAAASRPGSQTAAAQFLSIWEALLWNAFGWLAGR